MSRSGRRRIRAVLAGLVGAIAAGYGIVLFDPSVRTKRLTTAFAARGNCRATHREALPAYRASRSCAWGPIIISPPSERTASVPDHIADVSMPLNTDSGRAARVSEVIQDASRRLRRVCANLSDGDFNALIRHIAEITVKYEALAELQAARVPTPPTPHAPVRSDHARRDD